MLKVSMIKITLAKYKFDCDSTTEHRLTDTMPGTTTRISYTPTGGMFDRQSFAPAISGNGRYVAFMSSVLYPETQQASRVNRYYSSVFVRDTITGSTTLVSVPLGESPLGDSVKDGLGLLGGNIAISGDGRYVAFASESPNLVVGDNNFSVDFFVRDRLTNTTALVSVDSDERQAQYDSDAINKIGFGSDDIAMSADGRFIAFASKASNLVPNDTNQQTDIFVRDTVAGTTEIVSTDSEGNRTQPYGESNRPAISDDGRFVAFTSIAKNLVADDTNVLFDVFVKDRQTGKTVRVSTDSFGKQGVVTVSTDTGSGASSPSISADGRYVAFRAQFTNLVPGDTNGFNDIFVKDLQTNQIRRVSTNATDQQSNGSSSDPVISADGRYVAFASTSSNLVENDLLGAPDVFVKDLQTGSIIRVSVNSQGMQAMDGFLGTKSSHPAISADGRFIAFESNGANLVNDGLKRDTNQVFLRDTRADEPRPGGSPGNDPLIGKTPNGTLVSGAGNDTLIAGKGKQTLVGGAGRDRFVFSKLDRQVDRITDFEPRRDKIVLTSLIDRLFSKRYKGNPIADDYVRFSRRGAGTLISIRRDSNLQGLVMVENVAIAQLKSPKNFVF
jgi:Tol biopolymer transport system component